MRVGGQRRRRRAGRSSVGRHGERHHDGDRDRAAPGVTAAGAIDGSGGRQRGGGCRARHARAAAAQPGGESAAERVIGTSARSESGPPTWNPSLDARHSVDAGHARVEPWRASPRLWRACSSWRPGRRSRCSRERFADAGPRVRARRRSGARRVPRSATVSDLDFTTDATPDQILAIVAPIADAHWDIGREFGTIGARLGDETVEITTYRSDAYDGATRKPQVEFGTQPRGRPAPPRLHRQRDGAAAARLRARRPVRRRRRPARPACCAPPARPRSRSATTRCA